MLWRPLEAASPPAWKRAPPFRSNLPVVSLLRQSRSVTDPAVWAAKSRHRRARRPSVSGRTVNGLAGGDEVDPSRSGRSSRATRACRVDRGVRLRRPAPRSPRFTGRRWTSLVDGRGRCRRIRGGAADDVWADRGLLAFGASRARGLPGLVAKTSQVSRPCPGPHTVPGPDVHRSPGVAAAGGTQSARQDLGLLRLELGLGKHPRRFEFTELLELIEPVVGR